MPNKLRPILLALIAAAISAGPIGCGGDNEPSPSIPEESARTLLAKIEEIRANVDVGSCLVAEDRTDELLADIDELPANVNDDVRQALENGANNLKLLVADPSQCEGRTTTETTTTTEPTTTEEETTTTRTRPETTRTRPETTTTETRPDTTTTPTQTQQTTPTGGSGGIGPAGQ